MTTTTVLNIAKPKLKTFTIPIAGTSPLICHAWADEVKADIGAKSEGKVVAKRKIEPKKEFEGCLYRTSKGYGFPAAGFKKAMVRAASMTDLKMTEARMLFRIIANDGDLVEIKGKPTMRQDMVRVQNAGIVRTRAEFREWSASLLIRFDETLISQEQIAHLVMRAGESVGVGDWRPEKNGNFGCFEIK